MAKAEGPDREQHPHNGAMHLWAMVIDRVLGRLWWAISITGANLGKVARKRVPP